MRSSSVLAFRARRADYDGGARPHAVARRARARCAPRRGRRATSHASSPAGVRAARRGGRGGGSEERMAAPLTRRLAAAGCAAGSESAGLSWRHFAGLARSMEATAFGGVRRDKPACCSE